MASRGSGKIFVCLSFTLLSCMPLGALGGVTCERLGRSSCAFAVSSSGARCVLEKRLGRHGREEYTCRTSQITAAGLTSWIETDECVEACGLDRNSLGISSDSLLDAHFTKKLCSPTCYERCPNVVGLYFNLAAGEGVFLPNLCQRAGPRRSMTEIRSSPGSLLASAPDQTVETLSIHHAMPPL